jgi:hypothetical protein
VDYCLRLIKLKLTEAKRGWTRRTNHGHLVRLFWSSKRRINGNESILILLKISESRIHLRLDSTGKKSGFVLALEMIPNRKTGGKA